MKLGATVSNSWHLCTCIVAIRLTVHQPRLEHDSGPTPAPWPVLRLHYPRMGCHLVEHHPQQPIVL